MNADGSINKGRMVRISNLNASFYRPYADQLLASGHAYHCFCSAKTLEEMRHAQTLAKQPVKYDRRCLALSPEEVQIRCTALKPGDDHVIRLKIPEGTSTFVDAIRGEISFPNEDVDDPVLLKSNGFPSYHFAVVIDDHLMEITHVLRGEEWISSTPKQIILHQLLGWEMPTYAHVPLLLNPDKTKLSKRKGDVSVESYLLKGYLPEALINFLALLGWNPTGDRELYSLDELVKLFDLSKVNRGCRREYRKQWMNALYLFVDVSRAVCRRVYQAEYSFYAPSGNAAIASSEEQAMQQRALRIIRSRVQLFSDVPAFLAEMNTFAAHLEYDPSLLIWKKSTRRKRGSD